jgi:hypothetical protein
VPEGAVRGTVTLTDQRRCDVPVTLVCPEFSPDRAKEWVHGGDVPELSAVTELSYVDIGSGHWPPSWPSWARLLDAVVRGAA